MDFLEKIINYLLLGKHIFRFHKSLLHLLKQYKNLYLEVQFQLKDTLNVEMQILQIYQHLVETGNHCHRSQKVYRQERSYLSQAQAAASTPPRGAS